MNSKFWKRLISLLFTGLLLIGCAACSGSREDPMRTGPAEENDSGTETKEPDPGTETDEIKLPPEEPTYRLLSYNIAGYVTENPTEDQLNHNRNVVKILLSYQADILLLNEASPAIYEENKSISDIYGQVDTFFRDAANEVSSNIVMLYRKDLFELTSKSVFCLSDTPRVYSKVSESYHYRFAVFANFKRISDGREFTVIGTHLENNSTNSDIFERRNRARFLQTQCLSALMEQELLDEDAVILMGDLNSVRDGEHDLFRWSGVDDLLKDGRLADSADLADTASKVPSHTCGYTFDYILLTRSDFKVFSYDITEALAAPNPSDHYPVLVTLVFC